MVVMVMNYLLTGNVAHDPPSLTTTHTAKDGHNGGHTMSTKSAQRIAKAFFAGYSAKTHNCKTDGKTVLLHGNRIAWKEPSGEIDGHDNILFTLAGWPTQTTKTYLNAILAEFRKGCIHTEKGQHYYSEPGVPDWPISDATIWRLR